MAWGSVVDNVSWVLAEAGVTIPNAAKAKLRTTVQAIEALKFLAI